MKEILSSVPIYERREAELDAGLVNLVTIALKRLPAPVRISLPKLRTLDLLLDSDAWVVVDNSLNDIPVLAWVDFQLQGRSSLHQPVSCHLNLYHAHGDKLLSRIVEAMELILGERLTEDSDEAQVVEFRRDRPGGDG